MIQREFTFQNRMRMSEGVSKGKSIEEILLDCFPGAVKVEKANVTDDKKGTDYWVTDASGKRNSIDVKAREEDWQRTHPNEDDLALEMWSVVGKKVGWTRDVSKQTDYILWLWQDTGRWTLVPFPLLRHNFIKYCAFWCKRYKTAKQKSTWDGKPGSAQWESQCVFVPRRVVWGAIYSSFGGKPIAPEDRSA